MKQTLRKTLLNPKTRIVNLLKWPNPLFKHSRKNWIKTYILIMAFSLTFIPVFGQSNQKKEVVVSQQEHRVIILTDIGADPDDQESMVHLLLYSNEIEIKGLIATTSVWQSKPQPELIKNIIQAYGKVQANLNKNETGYPSAESLLKRVTHGIAKHGMKGVGQGENSPGSNLIIKVLKENDSRPLWICAWGGVNTLAQALYEIRKTEPKTVAKKLIARLRVYTISDQDNSGVWIRKNFPHLFYIVSPGDNYGSATWSAINGVFPGINNNVISNSWLEKNIQQGHGPLGAIYPDVSWGMEGDTPSWLGLIPNGLSYPSHPNWGGWGGRYELYTPKFNPKNRGNSGVPIVPETRPIWTNAVDTYTPYIPEKYGRTVQPDTITFKSNKATLFRWRVAFQNDFAARMEWCTESFKQANHPPVPKLLVPRHITVKSGQGFGLKATATDPDGDHLSYLWFNYPETGTYKKHIKISPANSPGVYIKAPVVNKKVTTQFILAVTDHGNPPLTRYERVFVTIMPK